MKPSTLHYLCQLKLLLSHLYTVSAYPCSLPLSTGSVSSPCSTVTNSSSTSPTYSTSSLRHSNSSMSPPYPPIAGGTDYQNTLFNVLAILLTFSTLVIACLQYKKKHRTVLVSRTTEDLNVNVGSNGNPMSTHSRLLFMLIILVLLGIIDTPSQQLTPR